MMCKYYSFLLYIATLVCKCKILEVFAVPWNYPKPEKRAFSYECAGRTLNDPFAWMEANDDATRAFVAAQNEFTTDWFVQNGDKVAARAALLAKKAEKPSYSDVQECHGRLYASRRSPAGETAAVVLDRDFNELFTLMDDEKAGGAFHVYGVSPCPADEDVAALFVLQNGAARPSVLLLRISSGDVFAALDGMFSFVWAPDGSALYYSDAVADSLAGTSINTVRAYELKTGEIRILYTERDSAVFVTLETAPAGDLFIHVNISYVNTRVLHFDPKTGAVTRMTPDDGHVYHHVGSMGDTHYFFTNNNAPKGKVVALFGTLDLGQAQEILPEDTRPLEGVMTAGDRMLAVYLNDVASEAELYDGNGARLGDLNLPDRLGALALSAERPPVLPVGAEALYLNFESFVCPPSVLRYDLKTGEVTIAYSRRGGAPRTDVAVEKQAITARDGTRILAFLVHKNGLTPNGDTPVLMYGYGGYNVSLNPNYTVFFMGLDVVDWVDKGGMYVHCILRGGSEYGAKWHEAGWRDSKKNAFFDFIDIAKWLVEAGWTKPSRIAINGGSNGGLLVTAAVTQQPEAFGAVVAAVPHTDMIRFCFDDRGPMYITEYGNPREEAMFEYMLSYSPYHNIKEGAAYPPIFVQTGEFDNNVPPYHAKKFAAKMQELNRNAPCLLRVLARGSHDLGTGDVFYRTSAEMQLFAERALGMDD